MSSSPEYSPTRFPDVIYDISDAAVQYAYSAPSYERNQPSAGAEKYRNGELTTTRAHEDAWATAKSLARVMGCDVRNLDIQPDGSVIIRNNPVR